MNLLIVNYHYYSTHQYEQGIYPVSPSFFAQQLEVISRKYRFISQKDLVQCISGNVFPKGDYCLITFDDGLKEQMHAFEWLKKNNIPAIFYIPVQPIVEKSVLAVHKLHHVRAAINDDRLLGMLRENFSYQYSEDDKLLAKNQYKYDNDKAREIKYQLNFKLGILDKKSFINSIFSDIYPDEISFSRKFYMNESDIRKLSSSDMLGSHGYSHVPLSKNSNAHKEVHKSMQFLENLTEKKIQSFSYPYGSKSAVDESVLSLFHGTNVVFGLTMWRGVNLLTESFNPYLLYRVDTNDAPGGRII